MCEIRQPSIAFLPSSDPQRPVAQHVQMRHWEPQDSYCDDCAAISDVTLPLVVGHVKISLDLGVTKS
jgi:hypothetical protein